MKLVFKVMNCSLKKNYYRKKIWTRKFAADADQ